jgi:hypothetical protein
MVVMDESLGQAVAALHAAELVHLGVVLRIEAAGGLLAFIDQLGRPFSRLHGGNVHVIGRFEALRLAAQIHLVKIERKPAAQPGVIDQKRTGPVVAMGIHRPMRENHIGLFGGQQFAEGS